MALTVQLTPWVLPSLLALLLVSRDVAFFWTRRREPGILTLLVLGGVTGVWAVLHVAGLVGTDPGYKTLFLEIRYVVAAVVPVAWLAFALAWARRFRDLRRWPALLLYLFSAGTVALAFGVDEGNVLVRQVRTVLLDGSVALQVDLGPWHWAHLTVRILAVSGGALVMAGAVSRREGGREGQLAVAAATVVALLPTLLRFVPASPLPAGPRGDLSPLAFAIAGTILGVGLLRDRLLTLGSVDRAVVLSELRDPVVVLDGRGRIVDANRAAGELGLRAWGDVPVSLGTLWATSRQGPPGGTTIVLPEATAGPPADPGAGSGAEGRGVADEPRDRVEEERVFEVIMTPLDEGGAPGRTAILLRDVTERERAEEALQRANAELERLANTDGLTGLSNRRHFMDLLARELDRSRRYGRPLSVVLLDLDRFKEVNDTWGHAAGDEVLRATARSLRAVSRDQDVPARLGGEEMAVLLPETDGEGARHVAERLRRELRERGHRSGDGDVFRVTASLGVASLNGATDSPEKLVGAADEALYRAKEGGRDRVEVARDVDGEGPD